jgi:hypothetical protein
MCRRLLLMVVLSIVTLACALNSRPTLSSGKMAELWQAPTDLERRDLLHGPGGLQFAPDVNSRYDFLRVKETGTQPGYDVKDARGLEWSIKQGVEGRTEVVVSRFAWALGYHQPYLYYLPQWTLTRDGQDTLQPGGRFRLEPTTQRKIGDWSWRKNPFLGTRPMTGLFVLMVMVNNWDLKTAQNAVYEVVEEDQDARYWYMARDLGASFGRTSWFSLGTKDDPPAFEREPFIKRVEGNRVRFHFQGAWREPQLHNSVTPDDVRWVCQLLNRLSAEQWRDAFRAGGYDEEEAARYIRRLQQKVAEGLDLG